MRGARRLWTGRPGEAEYDEQADLTSVHQSVNIHQVEQLVQGVDCSEADPKTNFTNLGWYHTGTQLIYIMYKKNCIYRAVQGAVSYV